MPVIVKKSTRSWHVFAVFAAFVLVLPVPVYFKDITYGLIPVFLSAFFAVGMTFMAFGYGLFVWPMFIFPSLVLMALSVWLEFRVAQSLCGFALRRISQNLHGVVVGVFVFSLIWVGILYGGAIRVDLEGKKKQVIVENVYWLAIKDMF